MARAPQTLPLFDEPEGSFVEVAVPVPVRQTFTYRVDPALEVPVGCRVAVPFGGRKVAGFALAGTESPPQDVARIRSVAGLIDPEPVFTMELLSFLQEAARYYMHPIGEVLRAAAPAIPREAIERLRKEGFLSKGEALPGAHIAARKEVVVRLVPGVDLPARLGARQRTLLGLVESSREISLSELRSVVPQAAAAVRRLVDRGVLATEERDVVADPFFGKPIIRDKPLELNDAQRVAADALLGAIAAAFDGNVETRVAPPAFLLHGVTGSGKTEVYLQAIAEAQKRELGALLMVPEIALTPQLVSRFRARFGDGIAVLHSGLSERQRNDAWRALRLGSVRLVIGARSALFAPVPSLGVLVVDEEHDASFKQEEGFRYNARDMALLRAKRAGALCVLGSATPAIETRHLADEGRLRYLRLPDRATAHPLPAVEVIDLARHRKGPSGHRLLSAPLHRAIEQALAGEGQVVLFLNRRGFAPSVRCTDCDEVMQCPACSVALTEHRAAGALRCHYCDFSTPIGRGCLQCGQTSLERIGLGTEQLEQHLTDAFAPARVARLDRDTARSGGVEAVLDRFRRREVDVLVGTQMVTKGHDIPGITLVGVVLADQSLAFPDFRAAERTFQLLSQVAGRAGRGDTPGRVLFQTFQPDHVAVTTASRHDYESFYAAELKARAELGYPPFARMVAVRVDAGDDEVAKESAEELCRTANRVSHVTSGAVQVLGPAQAPIHRLRGRYRYRLLLRSADRRKLRQVAAAVLARVSAGLAPARASVDVDPVAML